MSASRSRASTRLAREGSQAAPYAKARNVHLDLPAESASSSRALSVLSTTSTLTNLDDEEGEGETVPIPKQANSAQFKPSSFHASFELLGHTFQPTQAFDKLIEWINERQRMCDKRSQGLDYSYVYHYPCSLDSFLNYPSKWTDNPILRNNKFCNVYRFLDRSSQFFVRNVIDNPQLSKEPTEVIFRILVYTLFNKPETWTGLLDGLPDGDISWEAFDASTWIATLDVMKAGQESLYTGAHQIPNCPHKNTYTHVFHIAELIPSLMETLPSAIEKAEYAADIIEHLLTFPSIGPFIANQVFLNLSYWWPKFHPNDTIVAGKGCVEGLNRVFGEGMVKARFWIPDIDRAVLRWFVENQGRILNLDSRYTWRGLKLEGSNGKMGRLPLHLEDFEHALCELDKYCRPIFGVGLKSKDSNTRQSTNIKFRYTPRSDAPLITSSLPPSFLHRIRLPSKLGNSKDASGGYLPDHLSSHRQDSKGKWFFTVHWLYWDESTNHGDPSEESPETLPDWVIQEYAHRLRSIGQTIPFPVPRNHKK